MGRFSTIAVDMTYLALNGAGQVDLGAETMALKLHPLARLSGASVRCPCWSKGRSARCRDGWMRPVSTSWDC